MFSWEVVSKSKFKTPTAVSRHLKQHTSACEPASRLGDLEPVTLRSNSGKRYCMLTKSTNISDLLVDQPVGEWTLPIKNPTPHAPSIPISQSGILNHIILTSPFYKHLSDTKYIELSKSITDSINKDWTLFPQLRYAIPQLFPGAVTVDESVALMLNSLERYGRLRNLDAHFERRTGSTLYQPSYPKKKQEIVGFQLSPLKIISAIN